MMAGALLPFGFAVPILTAGLLWPELGEPDLWKVAAIFSSAVLYCCLLGFFKYFSFRLTVAQSIGKKSIIRLEK